MNIFVAILIAIIEGITEFLPISSTGHMTLAYAILKVPQTEFTKSYEIIIQIGAIFAIVYLYWKRIWTDKNLVKKVLLAFIPSAIISFVLYKFVKEVLISNPLVVIVSLIVGGVILIAFEKFRPKVNIEIEHEAPITTPHAVLIGLCQVLALIPGVSRSASTIIGALLLKESKKNAIEFSFLLAIPTMFAATGYDLYKTKAQFSLEEYLLLVMGVVIAFISALLSIKFFLKYVENHSFTVFGIYRIVIAVIAYLIIF
ncbi:MAG: undecaprenyl-diphosphate phosphatase [bacterium]|nr:undecaprenyl-diphosphate phosphatase [bacterium]